MAIGLPEGDGVVLADADGPTVGVFSGWEAPVIPAGPMALPPPPQDDRASANSMHTDVA